MHIFIDDSESFARNGFLCLAGFMASDAAWDRFCVRWCDLLEKYDLRVLHTSDFLSGQGEYRKFDMTYEARLQILSEFLDVVRDETECGIVCAIDAGAYRNVLGQERKRLKPEEFLFRRMLKRSFEFMTETGSVESIGVWLDDSDVTSSGFLSIWAATKKNWRFARSMLGSISFGDDQALPPLQAADAFANIMVRARASGLDPWHGQSPFSRLFIDPKTHAVARHIKAEIWEADDVTRLKTAVVQMAKPN